MRTLGCFCANSRRICDEDRRVGRAGHADRELTDLALVDARRQVGGVRRLRQDDPRLLHEHAARLGELHLALGAVEQLDPELFFELADLMAERRLAEMQPLGGAAEVQGFCQRDDVAKVSQLHCGRSLLQSRRRPRGAAGSGLSSPAHYQRIVAPSPYMRPCMMLFGAR